MKKEEKEPIKKPVEEKEKPTEEEFTIIREEITLTEKPEEEKVEKVEDEEKTGEENLVEKSALENPKVEEKPTKELTEVDEKADEKDQLETKEEKPKISSWDLEEETSPLYKKNKSFFRVILFVLIISIITGVLFFFFLNSESKKAPVEEKKTVEPTKAPEKAQINKSEWTLEVLNGSGVAGVAAKAAANLTEQGYTVINTGNADNQDYKKNELFVSENMQSKAQLLIDDLKNNYGFTEVKAVLKDSTASARIILGDE